MTECLPGRTLLLPRTVSGDWKTSSEMLPQNTVPAAGPSTFAQKIFSTIDFCKNPLYLTSLLVYWQAKQTDVFYAAKNGRLAQIQLVCTYTPERIFLLDQVKPPSADLSRTKHQGLI